jgi:hypothetical protein
MKRAVVLLVVALAIVVGARVTGQFVGKAMAAHQERATQQIMLLSR